MDHSMIVLAVSFLTDVLSSLQTFGVGLLNTDCTVSWKKNKTKKRNKKKQDSWTKCNTCLGKWALLLLARKSLEDKMMCEIR